MNLSPRVKNILEWIYCILIAVFVALAVKYYVGTPTIVKQPSMNNTLAEGQRLWLNRWVRTTKGTYNRGDIITFEAPSHIPQSFAEADSSNPVAIYDNEPQGLLEKFSYYVLELDKTSYIKRVIGVAGDHIKIDEGKVYLNGEELTESYIPAGSITKAGAFSEITVPEGYVFVMGDNREHSTDSRNFGCIPIEKIESRVGIRIWPLSKFGKVE